MEDNAITSWSAMPERSVEHLVSGFSLAVLEQVLMRNAAAKIFLNRHLSLSLFLSTIVLMISRWVSRKCSGQCGSVVHNFIASCSISSCFFGCRCPSYLSYRKKLFERTSVSLTNWSVTMSALVHYKTLLS